MILKLYMKHQGLELYKFYVNDDPGLTVTYFIARLSLVASALTYMGKMVRVI